MNTICIQILITLREARALDWSGSPLKGRETVSRELSDGHLQDARCVDVHPAVLAAIHPRAPALPLPFHRHFRRRRHDAQSLDPRRRAFARDCSAPHPQRGRRRLATPHPEQPTIKQDSSYM